MLIRFASFSLLVGRHLNGYSERNQVLAASVAEPSSPSAPTVIFVGDFNVGKSLLINALLRHNALPASGEESRALPTFVTRSVQHAATFAALPMGNGNSTPNRMRNS